MRASLQEIRSLFRKCSKFYAVVDIFRLTRLHAAQSRVSIGGCKKSLWLSSCNFIEIRLALISETARGAVAQYSCAAFTACETLPVFFKLAPSAMLEISLFITTARYRSRCRGVSLTQIGISCAAWFGENIRQPKACPSELFASTLEELPANQRRDRPSWLNFTKHFIDKAAHLGLSWRCVAVLRDLPQACFTEHKISLRKNFLSLLFWNLFRKQTTGALQHSLGRLLFRWKQGCFWGDAESL